MYFRLTILAFLLLSTHEVAFSQILRSLEEKKAVLDQKIMDFVGMITEVEQDYGCWIETDIMRVSDDLDGIKSDFVGQFYAANAKKSWKYWSRRLAYMGKPGASSHWYQFLVDKEGKTKRILGLQHPLRVDVIERSDNLEAGFERYLPPTMWCMLEASHVDYAIATHDFIIKLFITDIGHAKGDGQMYFADLTTEESGHLLATWSGSTKLVDGLHVEFVRQLRLHKDHGLPISGALKVKYNNIERTVNFVETEWQPKGKLFVPTSIHRVEENAIGNIHTEMFQTLKWILGEDHPDTSPAEDNEDWRLRYCRLLEVQCGSTP